MFRPLLAMKWLKTPGIHCYVAGSITAVTPRYITKKIRNALQSTKKRKGNDHLFSRDEKLLFFTLSADVWVVYKPIS
jgi:hypothetical protein